MRIKTLISTTLAVLALAACSGGDTAGAPKGEPIAKIAAPAGTAWVDVVSKTELGGYKMGNPDAPLKLVEYGAITCPGCAQFAVQASEELHEIVNSVAQAPKTRRATKPTYGSKQRRLEDKSQRSATKALRGKVGHGDQG